jgi:hypothetical protein
MTTCRTLSRFGEIAQRRHPGDPASRIFALARTMRWATSRRRKEGMSDLLVRPQISRSVRRSRIGGQRRMAAAEDQPQPVIVHASRARCSGRGLQALGHLASDASNRVRLRIAEMLLKRPVETSQARGFAECRHGHCSTAAVKVSIASSARSKSPSRLIKVASTRRESVR